MSDQRHIHVGAISHATRIAGHVALRFHGTNTSGASVEVLAQIPADLLPILADKLRASWQAEKFAREQEIATIDRALGPKLVCFKLDLTDGGKEAA